MTIKNIILEYMRTKKGDFNALALNVFSYQFDNCLPYQRYCNTLQLTPSHIDYWHQIPSVPTDVFREFDLCTFDPSVSTYVFETSGTTKEKKGKHYYRDMSLYDEAIRLSFMRGIGLDNQQSMTFRFLTPSFTEVNTSSLFYMLQQAMIWYGSQDSRFYMTNNQVDYAALERDLFDDIVKNRPIAIIGTAFSFVNVFDHWIEKKWQLPHGSVLMETGGLKGRSRELSRAALYALFDARLGIPRNCCYSEYGMTELSSQCYSLPNSDIFSLPHWMAVRVINPETGAEVNVGETGIIQLFDLANLETISAIMTSDLAMKQVNGFELIGRSPLAVLRGCSTRFEL